MTRRELREQCFKLLFCTAFYPEEERAEQIEQYFAEPAEKDYNEETMQEETVHDPAMDVYDGGYVRAKVEKILEKIPELDAEIDKVAKGWTTSRMGREELTILRLALYEMRCEDDVPDKVAINEAVELAKKFGGRDSAPFVNGILAKLV